MTSSIVSWQPGVYDSARPAMTKVTDENQQTTKVELTYGPNHNQVISKKEFGFNNELLRETRTDYVLSSGYSSPYWNNRHIFSLVKTNEIFDGVGNRVARTDYEYDNNAAQNGTGNPNLKAAPGVVMHNYWSDPFTTQTQDGPNCVYSQTGYEGCWSGESGYGEMYWDPYCNPYELCLEYEQVSAYDSNTIFRGNVTKITSYADAQNLTGAVVDTKKYDVTGNVVEETASCCQLKTYDYTIATQYAYPTTMLRGSADPNLSNVTAASYDFNTGLVLTSTDANGRTDTTNYDANTLRPTGTVSSTQAYTSIGYFDNEMQIIKETHEVGGNLANKTTTFLNGIGKVTEVANWVDGVFDVTDTKYNNLGQVWKQSNTYRAGSETPQWTETFYDALGRTKQVIAPDGSTSQAFYNESQRPDSASTLAGDTTRQVDAWGRERWSRTDALGRMVEVVEPNPNGNGGVFESGSLKTEYTYDTLNNLTQTAQGGQNRYFKYDSLKRLTRQKLAEQVAGLNEAGQYVGNGQWSEAFFYDDRNLIQKVDARGVKTNYLYNNDSLNRLQSVTYDKAGADTSIPIPDTSPLNLFYKTSGDKDRIDHIDTWWTTETNSYDIEGRVSDYSITFPAGASQSLTTSYLYDSLDRVTEIRYPKAYGMTGDPRKRVNANYDSSSRLQELKVDTQIQMSDIVYNPRSQVESVKTGLATGNADVEQYSYDAQTGLLTNQKVKKFNNNQTLLDLSYNYNRGNQNGKTGALTQIINNLDRNKDRVYEYDTLGRLKIAKGGGDTGVGGVQAHWTQNYTFDRWGNRTNVNVNPNSVTANNQAVPTDGLANLSYDQATNRINTAGYEY